MLSTITEGVASMAQVRIPAERPPTPPGEMLLEEFIRPLGMTQAELAGRTGVSYVRLNEIVNGRRGITPSTALRLAKALSTHAAKAYASQTAGWAVAARYVHGA